MTYIAIDQSYLPSGGTVTLTYSIDNAAPRPVKISLGADLLGANGDLVALVQLDLQRFSHESPFQLACPKVHDNKNERAHHRHAHSEF